MINCGPCLSRNLYFSEFFFRFVPPSSTLRHEFLCKILIDNHLKKTGCFRTSTEPPPILHLSNLRVVREKLRVVEKKFPCAQFFSHDVQMTDTNLTFCYHWSYHENYRF